MSSTGAAVQAAQFLNGLALAWKNLSSYPPGHPQLKSSLTLAAQQLHALRGPAGEVVLGIGVDAVFYGSIKIDSIPAQKFAQAIYARGVALVRFASETTVGDIEAFLRLLGAGTRENKRPLWDDLTRAGVMNINLEPVSYAGIRLTGDLDDRSTEARDKTLWDEVLRALLEGRHFSSQERPRQSASSADELWQMVAKYFVSAQDVPFDPDATFGVRIPIRERQDEIFTLFADTVGSYVANAGALKKQHSLEQAMQLLRTLPEPLRGMVLRAVIKALADETTPLLLRDFASVLPNDEVLDALRYLSSMGSLSGHAAALLQSLSTVKTPALEEGPPQNVIADLVRLFGEEDVDRFNPPDHQALLASLTISIPQIPADAMTALEPFDPQRKRETSFSILHRCVETIFELLSDLDPPGSSGPTARRLASIFESFVAAGAFAEAIELVRQANQIAGQTARDELKQALQESLAGVTSAKTVHRLIDLLPNATPEQAPAIHQLISELGSGATHHLLVALAGENNRSRRRRLFDFISSLGPTIVPEVRELLADSEWYVVRNMILLLRAVGDRSSLPQLHELARHHDLRVKLEAIKSLFALDSTVPRALLEEVILDPDPRAAEAGIALIGKYVIKEATEPLLRILEGRDVFGARRRLRVKALRALGDLGEPRALPALERFLKPSLLPWPSRVERYAAWESLAGYAPDARLPFVEEGVRSRDPRVRAIAERLPRS